MHDIIAIIADYLCYNLWTSKQQGRSEQSLSSPDSSATIPLWHWVISSVPPDIRGRSQSLEPRTSLYVQGQAPSRNGHLQIHPSKPRISVAKKGWGEFLGARSLIGPLLASRRPTAEPQAACRCLHPQGLVLIMMQSPSHAASATISGVRVHVQGH